MPETHLTTESHTTANAQSAPSSLRGLTIHPVLASEDSIDHVLAAKGDFPCHKYEKVLIQGFTRKMTTDEIARHPLVELVHDYKHLMLHGDRGSRQARAAKRSSKKPFENDYCRLSFVYTLAQDPTNFDLSIRFVLNTALNPFWANYDGSSRREMTPDEIAAVVANFIDEYVAEAKRLIKNEAASCLIEGKTVIIEPASDMPGAADKADDTVNPSKIATPPEHDLS